MKGRKEPTEFQQKVYAVVRSIPRGKVTTYGEIARAISCRSAQAVGQALRCNPYAPQVPCHRVIAGDLRIGGFFGSRGGNPITRKMKLLQSEGVWLNEDGSLADETQLWRFTESFTPAPTEAQFA